MGNLIFPSTKVRQNTAIAMEDKNTTNENIVKNECDHPKVPENAEDKPTSGDETAEKPKMSKNQLKKIQKHEKWVAGRLERRRREREKEKEKKAKKRQAALESGDLDNLPKKPRFHLMAESSCKTIVVIDCDYADFMSHYDIGKLCKQINRCYSINRANESPVQFYLTSVTGQIKEAMDRSQPGSDKWDCHKTEKHWKELFIDEMKMDKKSIVYLSGDSAEATPTLEDIQTSNNRVFIIGGLLDHNRHKGLSLTRANEAGVSHAQLPIGDHIQMCQRKVLAIPHVFEIMLLAANGSAGKDWTDIFQKVIPARKIENGVPKADADASSLPVS